MLNFKDKASFILFPKVFEYLQTSIDFKKITNEFDKKGIWWNFKSIRSLCVYSNPNEM